jgi:hypothetical protein
VPFARAKRHFTARASVTTRMPKRVRAFARTTGRPSSTKRISTGTCGLGAPTLPARSSAASDSR